ncbi:MAG: winged helix-turn-helix transcriptional regulator [Thermoprotei archaeon]|nr:winged helix-turn-helix transcriptional regulator [Thermoprotei archaeon]
MGRQESNGNQELEKLVSDLKALANITRLKILILCATKERSSKELREALGISKPLLIAHLRILLRVGLLTYRTEVDEERGIVKRFYRADSQICINKKYLSRI